MLQRNRLLACLTLVSVLFKPDQLAAEAAHSMEAAEPVLLWGDTHLHTSYSFDAFLNGNQSADPDVAYRFAKGQPVIHPYNRTRVQIGTPLDFLVVSDHAEFYGGIRDIYLDGLQGERSWLEKLVGQYRIRQIRNAIDTETGPAYFADLLPKAQDPYAAAKDWGRTNSANTPPGADVSARNAWARMIEIADRHNQPGTFTTLIGWEWSTIPGGANLHRVVITDASTEQAQQFQPFSSIDSPYPEDLWAWMAQTEQDIDARFLAIPHNSNISKGVMFADQTLRREPMTRAYADQRRRFEPVVEITQIKGDSETHPTLSPDDPFADFETYPWYIQQTRTKEYRPGTGDYVRAALKSGLRLAENLGSNPFQFGVIGSTDSHTGLSSAEEPNFWGKMAFDSTPERKQRPSLAIGPTGWSMQAGGLAAVWARSNSREDIIDALQRRSVYATTGPRIRLTFSASSTAPATAATAEAPASGTPSVTMGGELTASATAPVFSISALKDPASAPLDRVQIIKGWLDANGQTQEQVIDVVWAGDRTPDAAGAVPAIGSTVDLTRGTYAPAAGEPGIGAAELEARWQDPNHDPTIAAFYYVRVLEIPTPRHALLDALALGLEAPDEGPSVIQERAYSSPIWVAPQ